MKAKVKHKHLDFFTDIKFVDSKTSSKVKEKDYHLEACDLFQTVQMLIESYPLEVQMVALTKLVCQIYGMSMMEKSFMLKSLSEEWDNA